MTSTIRKESIDGCNCSVVQSGGFRRIFATAAPRGDGSFVEQAEDAFKSLHNVLQSEGAADSAVMQSIFLDDTENRTACRKMVREYYGKNLPATAYLFQPPCDGKRIAIEAWAIADDDKSIEIERRDERMVLVRQPGIEWAYLADICSDAAKPVYEGSLAAFRAAEKLLTGAGMRFDDAMRTWLYLGGITEPEGATTRYLELNRARTDFYRGRKFAEGLVPSDWNRPVFPASTGIGAKGSEMALACLAIKAQRPDITLIPLENPRQTAACDYAHQYGKESPKFARAMAVVEGDSVATYISGTASITASDTRHENDFERQMLQTLDNIEVLLSRENFRQYGFPNLGATLDDLAFARIYVKNPADSSIAATILRQKLGPLPTIQVVADICRPELLVEIEAMAFS
jgi:enamine deaminase RidA (YjgF/YER057c/UK114 family)